MKKFIPVLLALPSLAFAVQTTTVAKVTNNLNAKVETSVRLTSHHEFTVINNTTSKKIYMMHMTLCPQDKQEQCVNAVDPLGLEAGQSYTYKRDLSVNVWYRKTGDHGIFASSYIDNNQNVTNDQKYLYVHY